MATKTKTVNTSQPKEPKKICQYRDCDAMGKYQLSNNFYKSRNVSIGYHPCCKQCINNKIVNIDDMQTVYDVLQTLDTPFIQEIWTEALADVDENYIDKYLELINNTYKTRYENARFKDSIYEKTSSIEKDENGNEIKEWDDDWQGYYSKRELAYLNKYYQDLNNDFKIITSSNTVEPISYNLNNSYEKGTKYRYTNGGYQIFCTVTPSLAPTFKPNNLPLLGNSGETVKLVNTKFNPIMIELELVEHDDETISYMLEGNQLIDKDNALVTTFNDNGEIYHQSEYGVYKDSYGNPLYEFKKTRDNIDFNQNLDNLE